MLNGLIKAGAFQRFHMRPEPGDLLLEITALFAPVLYGLVKTGDAGLQLRDCLVRALRLQIGDGRSLPRQFGLRGIYPCLKLIVRECLFGVRKLTRALFQPLLAVVIPRLDGAKFGLEPA